MRKRPDTAAVPDKPPARRTQPAIRALIFWTLLLTGPMVHAQTGARVTGRVLDQTGAVLPGVAIDLAIGATELTGTTNEAGAVSVRAGAGRQRRAHLPAAQLHRAAPERRRAGARVGCGRCRADAVAQRRRDRDRHRDVSKRRRHRAPGGEPGRHRVGGQPGSDHRGAARRASDDARRRSAGNGPGNDRQPAQRRGESQSVLPARLQPRSRDRLLDERGRCAGEHAHAARTRTAIRTSGS